MARVMQHEEEEKVIEDPGERVHVWPHLVSIELVGALIYLLALSLMSILIRAPLVDLANPEVTPNPAKAPWYFLGLQELLLHMHPALAGVIVPRRCLDSCLAAIPYIDRTERGPASGSATPKGIPITKFSAVYTAVWIVGLVLFDEFLPAGEGAHGISPLLELYGAPAEVGIIFVPLVFMTFIPWSLAVIVKRRWNANTAGDYDRALYSFFLASFVVLTIVGTAFRGHSMQLMWPWEIGAPGGLHGVIGLLSITGSCPG